MTTHSSVLAWRVPGRGEPGGLPSLALHKVGHDPSDLATDSGIREFSRKKTFIHKVKLFSTRAPKLLSGERTVFQQMMLKKMDNHMEKKESRLLHCTISKT